MGGYMYAHVDVETPGVPTQDANYHGFVLGAGAEYAVLDWLSLEGRYIFSHLPKESYSFGGPASSYGENGHNFTLGVNLRY